MAAEDQYQQKVRPGGEATGEWVTLIHDCYTPSRDQIAAKKAAAGTVWGCSDCNDKWKLTLSSGGFGSTELQWRRLGENNEEEE